MKPQTTPYHPPAERTLFLAANGAPTSRFLVWPAIYRVVKPKKNPDPDMGSGWYVRDIDGRSNLWLNAPAACLWTSDTVFAALREMRTFSGPHVAESACVTVNEKTSYYGGYEVHYTVEFSTAERLSLQLGDTRVGSEPEHLSESLRFWLDHLAAQGPLALSECGTKLTRIIRDTACTA